MNTLQLGKYQGFGNDFLVAFHVAGSDTELANLARTLCDRRRGIGADGLLIGESAADASAQMVLYNADGSRAEMSGNGIRCFAHALLGRRGDTPPAELLIATDAGQLTHVGPIEPDGVQAGRIYVVANPQKLARLYGVTALTRS